ncbi:ATP-binding protein [Paenibacillus sp. JX-17]|uniref:ATP-binding protein n=1 Tax=Paenibacillus lacisoli TaxID=3064525 RepID=A0ABT9CM70_9BACL|nr:anti-phage-associated helicase HerA [Paenibacillus sp. JX-17]MDO7908698.1 ATP-binding protein [Paenibacillus sp. JX-17]
MSMFDIEEKVAKVISVLPNKIKIEINNIEQFKLQSEKFSVGSYLRVSDSEDCALICIIENFTIQKEENKDSIYLIEAMPIGFLDVDGKFTRGGNNIAIPPTDVETAKNEEIQQIYDSIEIDSKFCFASLSQDKSIKVPVNGNKFFNKHIAVVGSTGSGKSHTVAKILQEATLTKNVGYKNLNNSHIVIFDIHSEYHTAFPHANYLDVDSLFLPYWLMNGEELEELLVETGENQAYNQSSLLRRIITRNKQTTHDNSNLTYDAPVKFSVSEVLNCLLNLSRETKNYKSPNKMSIKSNEQSFETDEEKFDFYFKKQYEFEEAKSQSFSKGTYNDGSLEKFISRIRNKYLDKRLEFLFGEKSESHTFESTLRQILGYEEDRESNVTIIDLSGVPFEVLSITVSLISRLIFEYGYHYKKMLEKVQSNNEVNLEYAPILLVYEEAHKYVPKNSSAKYNASRVSIERIAKEGRKYGVSAMIVSQRPSEISETIFSQCSNFVSMRLTNPEDQNYVKRLMPDTLGPLTDSLPTLKEGDAILLGDALIMPSLVTIDRCAPSPSSNDIMYLEHWKKEWLDISFDKLAERWIK